MPAQHAATPPAALAGSGRRALLVDGHTRTWWSRGEHQAATLVEARDDPDTQAAVAEPRRGAPGPGPRPPGRPRANPAFTEALFVELMRAGQLGRAFTQLSPECQAAWGTPARFAAEQPGEALRAVQGVEIHGVRYLDRWTDPMTATPYSDVAELEVEYRLSGGGRSRALRQIVHLVPVEGNWRSVYHPPRAAS
ncbi:MAG: hypothetical protein ABR541_01875 [Candidatus Dormibacteria bacterium]